MGSDEAHDEAASGAGATGDDLDDAVARVWERVAATVAARREDLDCFLAEVLGSGGDADDAGPVRVLVAADSEPARRVLALRLSLDERFVVVSEAASPEQVVAEGVASLPDLVVVKLTAAERVWLDALGELTAWSPRTRMVAVSGIHAEHLAQVVLTPQVARDLAAGRAPIVGVGAHTTGAAPAAVLPSGGAAHADVAAAPRSLIHEVMRQMGIPVRARR